MPSQRSGRETRRIGLSEAKALFDSGEAIFVDVRDHDDYRQARVPCSISMPLREIPRRLQELPRDRKLVFY